MPGIFISYPFNPIYGIIFFFCFYSQFCFICRVHHKTIFITFFVISMSTDYYFPLMSVQSQLIQTREIDVLAGFWRYMILKSHPFDTYYNELWFSKNIYRNRGYVQASTKKNPLNKDLFLVKDNWDINVIISQNVIDRSQWMKWKKLELNYRYISALCNIGYKNHTYTYLIWWHLKPSC